MHSNSVIAGSHRSSICKILRNLNTVLHDDGTILRSTKQCTKVAVSQTPHQYLVSPFFLLDNVHSDRREALFHGLFDVHFLDD